MSRTLLPLLFATTIDPNQPDGIPLTDNSPDDLDVAGRATWDLLDEDGDVIETVSGDTYAVKEYGEEIGAVEMVEGEEEIGRRTRESAKSAARTRAASCAVCAGRALRSGWTR
ncbi:MAG: hypothetical protein IPI35_35485 [Deltaproteobacteria bacterium]|nr:hypothetical protein [Deltaproteobacteria bacterium]